jgi:endogenous inhibitor of DNA gyrase (YacG/DUF329 family)
MIEFPCPGCGYKIAVARKDPQAVRPVGRGDPGCLMVRVECPGCGRLVVRTVLR